MHTRADLLECLERTGADGVISGRSGGPLRCFVIGGGGGPPVSSTLASAVRAASRAGLDPSAPTRATTEM